jgi:O-antigen/teichoic acid export membrane protein
VTILWEITRNELEVAEFSLVQKTGANITQILTIFLGGMLLSILPTYLKNKQFEKAEKITGKVGKMIMYITSLILLTLTLFPDVFIWIFYGSENIVDERLLWFSFFQIIWAVSALSVRHIFVSQNKIIYLYVIFFIRTVVFLVCAYTLTPKYGKGGMFATVAISYTINSISNVIISAKAGKVNYFKYYWKLFVIYLVMQGINIVIFLFLEHILWIRVVLLLISMVLYHILIVYMGGLVKEDVEYIKSIVDSMKIFEWKFIKNIKDWSFRLINKIPFKDKPY